MKNLSFKTKLVLLVTTAVAGLLVFGIVSFMTLSKVEVGSEIYRRIVMIKDVNADYVPPTQSLAVGAVHAVQMEEASDAATTEQFRKQLQQDKKDFEEGHEKWIKTLPEGKLKELVGSEAYRTAQEWFRIAEEEFVPALERGDRKKAHEIRTTAMAKQYAAQEATVDAIVKVTNDMVAADEMAAGETVESRRRWMILAGIVAVGVLMGLAYAIARSILDPLYRTLAVLEGLAAKDLSQQVSVEAADEIGTMGTALNQAVTGIAHLIDSILKSAEQVAAASGELSATSEQITANSEETTAQAQVVSDAGHQVNTNLQTLASGAEEMNSTIGEIAKNATEAARVAGEAVAAAEAANHTVSKLGDSSVEIEKVIEVITSIAQQTNLLALNATIEAARAGEAGKGFAVVANEVKELAKQTAKATEEIKQKISVIRENTGGAVAAITGIKGVIDKVSHISTAIATAVEEQSATTGEMTRNVAEAARGAGTISENIRGVAEAAQSTSTNVGESQTATEHLAKMATQLRDLVGQFKVSSGSTTGHEGRLAKARAAAV
jgi:methyl-accepting chemotaxis protein